MERLTRTSGLMCGILGSVYGRDMERLTSSANQCSDPKTPPSYMQEGKDKLCKSKLRDHARNFKFVSTFNIWRRLTTVILRQRVPNVM